MDEPTPLTQADYNGAAEPRATGLADRLLRRFGLGAIPQKRRAFFARLELLAQNSPPIYQIISEAAAQSTGKRSPDRYFCRAVTMKLREANVHPDV